MGAQASGPIFSLLNWLAAHGRLSGGEEQLGRLRRKRRRDFEDEDWSEEPLPPRRTTLGRRGAPIAAEPQRKSGLRPLDRRAQKGANKQLSGRPELYGQARPLRP